MIEQVATASGALMDNLSADSCRALNLRTLLYRAGITKRSGVEVVQVVFLLLMRVFLRDSSIAMFCRRSMQEFCDASKDALYDLLKNPTVNWRQFHQLMALKAYQNLGLQLSELKAFVIDDTLKLRFGNHMEGVSRHYDHTSGQYVMGHHAVQLGLVSEKEFLPLDNQLYISSKAISGLNRAYKDGRSIVAR